MPKRNGKIKVSKKFLVKEHKELVPKLHKAGLHKEAREQARELKSIKRRKATKKK